MKAGNKAENYEMGVAVERVSRTDETYLKPENFWNMLPRLPFLINFSLL